MIYLIFGSDTARSHEVLDKLVAQFIREEKNLPLFKVDEESFSETVFNKLLKTETLFAQKSLIVAKRLFGDSLIADFLLKNLNKYASSDNIFIFWEEEAKRECLDLIRKHSTNVQEIKLKPTREKIAKRNDLFRLSDCIALRKRHLSWLLYQDALLKGIPAEEIFWKVFWQIKTLLLVKKENRPQLHPFVYKKSKKAVSLFKETELIKYSGDLVDLYHNTRRGLTDFDTGLEKFILKI